VQALGIPSWSAGYNILADDKKSSTCIMSSEGQMQSAFQLPFANSGEPSFAEWLQAIENEETFFVQELSGKAIEDHYNYMKTLPQVGPVIKELEDAGLSLPTYQVNHLSFFNGGFLLFITYEQVPHVHDIFKRFTKVFEQTYTRFLDLQKAEAQSREAQIQLALERVRATTMAMQKSDELLQASQVLFEQFRQLGQHPDQLTIGIMNELDGIVEVNGTLHGQQLPTVFRHPISEPYVMNKVFNAWKAGERALMLQLSADELEAYNHFRNKLVGKEMFATHVVADQKRVIYASYFSNGMIAFGDIEQPSSETRDILDRFAKVFEQTYTRFLDLQNAEAQAREAQIEAALERVRSKTMAMHKSEELPGAATLLFQQIQILKIPAFAAGYCIWEEEKQAITLWMSSEGVLQPPFKAPTTEDELFIQMRKGFEEGKSLHVVEMGGEELVAHYRYMRTLPVVGDIFDSILEAGHPLPTFQIMHQAYFSRGFLLFITYEPVPEAHDIFKRFAKVFEQTYTRFLDLQKAEAQAREAQIELGLERVRAKAMAMQKTDDLAGAVAIIFEELDKLDIGILRCGIGIINKENRSVNVWTTSKSAENTPVQISGDESMDTHPLLQGAFNAWLKQEDYSYVLQGPDLNNYYKTQVTANFKLPESQSLVEGHEDICQYYFVAMFQAGGLFAFRDKPFSDEAKLVMKRFATVFNLTYKRFLDLQKAEAQAREAQIELALERVRARAMAMQKSDELADAAQLLYHEFGTLGINTFTCGYQFIKEEKNTQTAWVVLPDGTLLPNFIDFPLTGDPVLDSRYKDWKENVPLHIFEIYGEANKAHHRFLSDYVPPFVVQDIFSRIPDRVTFYCANFSEGYLFIIATQPLSQDEEQTIIRFAKVFEMTYTRFLDLQKAEAQTREAQIEASLERLRSKTMAMHNSEDVADTVAAMFDELVKLGIETVRCGIAIIHDINQMEVWTAKPGNDGKVSLIIGNLGMTMHPMLLQVHDSWKNKESHTSYELVGEDLKDYFKTINNSPNYPIRYDVEALPYRQINNAYYFPEGALFAFSNQPVSVESSNILKRFAGVFGQTYRRFLDLQKAESQAREATIEAALEKVRGKAMAMHNSNDISITASLVFTELRKLGITPIRCGVGLLNKQSRRGQLYSATSSADGDSLSLVGWVELSGHPVLQNIYDTWDKNKEYYPELSGEELKSYYESLLSGIAVPVPRWQSGQKQYGTFLPFTVGCLYAWSAAPYNNEEIKILKRFASIIDLTFRRYMELQTSETNAREAVKQSALDRIRADIASMRTITDLERITPLIWNELTVLGIPFIRCGIFIMDDSQGLIHTFLSTPEGKAIAAFHLPYTTPGNIAQVLKHWQNKKAYIDHWDESAFTEFADILVEQGGLASAEQYLKTIPHGGFYLHFLPFLQGMLYVGNTAQLGEDELRLIQSVAEAFSTAYARYEDFNKLEAAKKQVDSTLNELQATQKQLIQSEKMASLGELTAGIAHEIQNPLNFVNNFSEVSTELLEEMITELKNNNKEDAIVIAADVKQNLEKILHHGKRADGIVKGMLQHSRTSSAVKESTDINKLADEYLRLAYHGLRAKDNFFNATIKTDYEDSLGNINIIPQDIGRVILNLITNAFYAVTEKRKQGTNGYEPIVAISTKKFDDKVELKVSDNGNGIPEKIKEKIFNPFFTTKPTGQGTGLGLSLSYDIVKAHGGEITVKSKNGEGSEFTINLPIT
jgi:signal transduction histidine kinase